MTFSVLKVHYIHISTTIGFNDAKT